jgi:cell division protein FtsL
MRSPNGDKLTAWAGCMKDALPDEMMLRRYLLGQLDGFPELADKLHDQMLSDENLSEVAGVIEDEIIEDYLEGTLSPADRQAVEEHFLRPPERQKKLRIARRLQQHFEAENEGTAQPPAKNRPGNVIAFSWRSRFRTYAEIAAGLLIVAAGALYINTQRHGFQSEISKNQHELASERERAATLNQQVQDLRVLQQPSTVMLSLLKPGVERGDAQFPEVTIGSGTQGIHVEIVLPGNAAGPYDVRLETSAGKTIWSDSQQWPFKSQASSLLLLDLPAQGLAPGNYRFVVGDPHTGSPLFYLFHVLTR